MHVKQPSMSDEHGHEHQPQQPVHLSTTLLHVAWMAIVLGLVLQALALLLAAGLAISTEGVVTLASVAGNLAWSEVVCVGLALGMVVSQGRPPLDWQGFCRLPSRSPLPDQSSEG